MLIEAAFLFSLCWLLAQVEIQIEGEHGWAEKLPTWRVSDPWLLKLTNGKPMTGYHVYLTLFLILFFHIPLLFVPYSHAVEGRILSYYFLTTIAWDFQWFVWNPAWGIRRFLSERIWWFPTKFMRLPLEYYLGAGSSLAATALLWRPGLAHWAGLFLRLATASLLSTFVAEVFRLFREKPL